MDVAADDDQVGAGTGVQQAVQGAAVGDLHLDLAQARDLLHPVVDAVAGRCCLRGEHPAWVQHVLKRAGVNLPDVADDQFGATQPGFFSGPPQCGVGGPGAAHADQDAARLGAEIRAARACRT